MYRTLISLSFVVLLCIGAATAATICPFNIPSPSEAARTTFNGNLTNGGLINGIFFVTEDTLLGQSGEVTGFVSESKDAMGRGTDIEYADTQAVSMNTFTGETGISLGSGKVNYEQSLVYSYATPNPIADENSTYVPFCEQGMSRVDIMFTSGSVGAQSNVIGFVGTNSLSHVSAIEGFGKYSAESGYNMMQGFNGTVSNYVSTKDRVTFLGDLQFGRTVNFKSVKS